MTSTTLNYKGGFKAAFIKTFKQQLPGAIVLIVISLFASIFSAATTIMDNAVSIMETTKYSITDESLILANSLGVVCIIFSFFIAVQMFKEIYSKRACDTFFAMPIKRSEYFCAKYLIGVLFNIVPILLAVGVNSVILLSASTKMITYTIDFALLLKVLVPLVFGIICFYSIFIFCAVLSGRRMHYFFLVAIALFAPMCITNGIIDVINSIWGAYVKSYPLIMIHPVQSFPMLMFDGLAEETTIDTSRFVTIFLVEVVEIIALFFGGYLLFKKRKAEIAEFTLSGKVIPFVFLAITVAAEFLRTSAEIKYFIAIPLAIVFSVIVTIIFSGIFYKKVFTKKTLITFAVSSTACILFVGAVMLPSYSNYVKYVPETDEIESVELHDGMTEYINYSSLSYITDVLSAYDFIQSGTYKLTTAENIENAINLHKKIVEDETIKKGKSLNSDTWGDMMDYNYEYESSYECRFVYHLKNGKTVTRKYSVPAKMISDEMVALMQTDEVLSQIGITSVDDENLIYAVYNVEDNEDNGNLKRNTRTLNQQEIVGLLNAYKEDLLNNTNKDEFLGYLSMYTGYYVDIYNDIDDTDWDETVDTELFDYEYADNQRWVYIAYFYPDVSDKDREYYKSLSIEELDRLSAVSEEYHEKINTDSFDINPEYKQTYKYAQSIGLID